MGFLPGAMPQALLMSPRWGLPGRYTGFINVAPLGLFARGDAPGYINVAPLGLFARGDAPGAMPQAILMSPRWGFSPGKPQRFFILNSH